MASPGATAAQVLQTLPARSWPITWALSLLPAIYQHFKASHVGRWEQGKPYTTSAEIESFLTQPAIRGAAG